MNRTQFTSALRTALMQLDDFQSLQSNPLFPLLLGDDAAASPMALQQLLLDAIDSLRHTGRALAPRMHQILYYRYAEGHTQKEAAYQLGISERQLRREQANAIECLADRLLKRLALSPQPSGPPASRSAPSPDNSDLTLSKEIAWLRERLGTETSHVPAELAKAMEGALVLADAYHVTLQLVPPSSLPMVAMPPSILRQALLTALTAAIPQVGGGRLRVAVAPSRNDVVITVKEASVGPKDGSILEPDLTALHTTSHLVVPFGGRVTVQSVRPLSIQVLVPAVGSVPVLVIEDNPDTQQLFQRYTEHSRFRVIGIADCEEAIAVAQSVEARVILLDIMMPPTDGWDLLARLRHHPATQDIPIVVCTILPHRELASLLGATAFLQKPVGQQALLETLDRLTAQPVVPGNGG
jgi:CheY-like chemotaxis protein